MTWPPPTACHPTRWKRPSGRSSRPIAPRCLRTVVTSSRGFTSSTSRARWSASEASAHARSSPCCRGAMSRTRCSCRSRRPPRPSSRTTCQGAATSTHGERVVKGQLKLQAASDIFLGWTQGRETNRYFYWRQLRDMKGSALVEAMSPPALGFYGELCGWTLARAHARSGDPISISEYLGGRRHVRPSDDRLRQAVRQTAMSSTTTSSSARSGPEGCKRWKTPDHQFRSSPGPVRQAGRAADAVQPSNDVPVVPACRRRWGRTQLGWAEPQTEEHRMPPVGSP